MEKDTSLRQNSPYGDRFKSDASFFLFRMIVEYEERIRTGELRREDEESRNLVALIMVHIGLAFESLDYDFTEELSDALCDFIPFESLADWEDRFLIQASSLLNRKARSNLYFFPFIAMSNYGLPGGRLPEEITDAIYARLKEYFPKRYEIRVNTDILPPMFFDITPDELRQSLIKALGARPGAGCFFPSDETKEELLECKAGMRMLAFIVTVPAPTEWQHFIEELGPKNLDENALRRDLVKILQPLLEKHYLATKFWFLSYHGRKLNHYLKSLELSDTYEERPWYIARDALYECDKLFRHIAVKAALVQIKEDTGELAEDLLAGVGCFCDYTEDGEEAVVEYRIGICLRKDPGEVECGVVWHVIDEDQKDDIYRVLTYYGFRTENIHYYSQSFSYNFSEKDFEQFPAFEGGLKTIEPAGSGESQPKAEPPRILN